MSDAPDHPRDEEPVSLWRLLLIPLVAFLIGVVQSAISLLQYREPAPAVSIGVMGGIVSLLALSISIGYEVIRQRRAGSRPRGYSRLQTIGTSVSFVGPQLLGYTAAGGYFGRGGALLPSIGIAILATAVGLIVAIPLMWWALPRFDPRFR